MIDMEKARRERTRWVILESAHHGGVYGINESLIEKILRDLQLYDGPEGLRRNFAHLEQSGLIRTAGRELEAIEWTITLTALGYNVVDRAVPCPPGIDRPPKYWQGH